MTRALAILLISSTALAWEPQTHSGLTEQAALSSALHKLLVERLGLPLGLYEPLTLHRGSEADRDLLRRAAALDPEGGYAVDDGRQTALGWLTAGAVLEGVPASRNRHHFLDPRDGRGLHDLESGLKLRTRMADVHTGIGSIRGVFTGTNFDGSGLPSTQWISGNENEWGWQRFLDERERAATARLPTEREDALVRALLAAGAILHVVEDAGNPAHVRNDYRVALEGDGARMERLAALRYGRTGLPEGDDKASAPKRLHLMDLIVSLAERTQKRFFSDGTLPDTKRYPLPGAFAGDAPAGYAHGEGFAHLARWERTPNGVRWMLDDACLRDYAEALLPDTERHARAALELLFHGRLEIHHDGDQLTVRAGSALGAGTASLYVDNPAGERQPLDRKAISGSSEDQTVLVAHRPAGSKHATAVFRGLDAAGEPVVIVEEINLR
jgi:hypothetical protein